MGPVSSKSLKCAFLGIRMTKLDMLDHTGSCVCFILALWCSGRCHEGTISGLRGIFRKAEWPGTYETLLVLFLSLTSGSVECSHLSQWAVFAFPRSGGSFEVLCMTSTDSFSVLGVGGPLQMSPDLLRRA